MIGVGTEARPRDGRRVVLPPEQRDDVLRLSLLVVSLRPPDVPPDVPLEGSDLRLMESAARRAATDLRGSLKVRAHRILFELPAASA